MPVLSAAICSRSGKSLMSRQFVDMQRSRIESLLSAFPKLMGTGGGNNLESKKIHVNILLLKQKVVAIYSNH